MVGEDDGGGYLSVGQRGVHAGDVQVAAVVRPLAPVGRHEGRHPAAVGVAQGLALLRAVGEQVGACGVDTDQGGWRERWKDGNVNGRLQRCKGR